MLLAVLLPPLWIDREIVEISELFEQIDSDLAGRALSFHNVGKDGMPEGGVLRVASPKALHQLIGELAGQGQEALAQFFLRVQHALPDQLYEGCQHLCWRLLRRHQWRHSTDEITALFPSPLPVVCDLLLEGDGSLL